ncbi:CoA-binding protein [Texcoconibacillus texcoconensis]|uniref:Putative CoA-binding protein n=1 Tax=Texcoconibacillus texcoconensis TaxID=1095777 RepID=A0A840QSM7_9BACI|nr:CoA-binding protein [Texcoconibacillus texcoconensis]MBB5174526.1 putative CoA-binding protein [Texcoconibacillus texcoconensis]
MAFENPTRDEIKKILQESETIAVVGLSDNPERTSYMVSAAMQDAGYKIIPVNPNVEEVLGVKAVSTLDELDEDVDIINVFRRSEFLPQIAELAAKTSASVFWAQQGVYSEQAAEIVQNEGMKVVMDRCIKVEHAMTKKN